MLTVRAGDFAAHLRSRSGAAPLAGAQPDAAGTDGERSLRKLWEASELSASDFADEVARFYKLPRIALPDLLSARPLVHRFSRRFLREVTVFPFQGAGDAPAIALADPGDSAAIRAAAVMAASHHTGSPELDHQQ
ncbi:MAG: hypothetical protein HC900_13010 [Methylacidiphilales bacterium]|nr:hypothetical protein [Candidatus Methylacidiphilales bacterium]